MVTKDTPVEDVLNTPGVITFFIEKGVSPFSCAGSFPGNLGKLLDLKKVKDPQTFINELNEFLNQQTQKEK